MHNHAENYAFIGDDAEFDHVGIAVKSIDSLFPNLTKFNDPIQKVNVAFINAHNLQMELIEPVGDDSPVVNTLKKNQSLYHLAYKVKNIEEAIEEAQNHEFHCIAAPVPATAFENKKIAWIFSRAYGLIELIEK